ncbi:hypothetical protein EVAR_20465_1 [Eumeta japonica]|uniref:Uncharacterized protein n=1 Tax=Eumeta variegata TaxID=151549 RepID=A0A4C1TXY5_EUMVA|nr:hypothetical protein EVAR_20465_1 [Eumeta japonica]
MSVKNERCTKIVPCADLWFPPIILRNRHEVAVASAARATARAGGARELRCGTGDHEAASGEETIIMNGGERDGRHQKLH